MADDFDLGDDSIPFVDEIDAIPFGAPETEKKWNKIGEQFSARPVAMQKSAAYRVLNNAERMMLDRIEIELSSHGGQDNGALPVTFSDFEEYGIRYPSIAPSRRALVALGFITFEAGKYSNPTRQDPNRFGLTYKLMSQSRNPLHRWRRMPNDVLQCERIAKDARVGKV
jgi:hypothetical protein